jgi:hypothetical protein
MYDSWLSQYVIDGNRNQFWDTINRSFFFKNNKTNIEILLIFIFTELLYRWLAAYLDS